MIHHTPTLVPFAIAADRAGLTLGALQQRRKRGQVPQAVKLAGRWFVPSDVVIDGPQTAGRKAGLHSATTPKI